MPNESEDFITLLKEGKIEEARAWVEILKTKHKYGPDMIVVPNGKPPRFTKRGKQVELGDDGTWRLKPKP